MKRFKCMLLALVLCLVSLCEVWAETPRLLWGGLGDPSAIIIDNTVYVTGTDGTNNVTIKTLPKANLYSAVPANYLSAFYSYNPSSFGVGTFTGVMSQHLTNEVGGNVGLMFTANKNGLATSSYYSYNLAAPTTINAGLTQYPHTDTSYWNGTQAQEQLKIRISDDIFIDDVDNDGLESTDPRYHAYTWFYNGNNLSLWQQGGTGAQTTPTTVTLGSQGWGDNIAEGAEIFKRGNYYYLIFSTNHWLGGYDMWYKRATTVAGLSGAISYRLTYPVPLSGVWSNLYQQYGYSKNAGGPCVLIDGSNYNLIFHVGTPISGTYMYPAAPNTHRATYVVRLVFTAANLIETVTLP